LFGRYAVLWSQSRSRKEPKLWPELEPIYEVLTPAPGSRSY
jgi:hypothetical protein